MPNSLDIHNLALAQWRQAMRTGDFQRGKAYAAQGRSTVVHLQGNRLTARCSGSAGRVYQQNIALLPQADYYDINGRCSCYVGYNCKHVVAALLTLEQLQQQGTPPMSLAADEPQADQQAKSARPTPALQ